MPENENAPLPNPMPSTAPRAAGGSKPAFFMALLAVLLAGGQWLASRQQINETAQDVTRRLAAFDAAHQEDRGAQKELRQQIEALQAKLGVAEARLSEFEGQNTALGNLYQEIAQSREEATLLEVEQAITLAGQQLQLAGNVPIAILALQTADARLARLDRPQYLPLRKALAKDLSRLSALPFADIPGISLRLEQLVGMVDKLPLRAYGRPLKTAENHPPAAVLPWWQRGAAEVWQEIKGLVRIQRFDPTAPELLAPGQDFFLRENLKLRLLSARLALLARDQQTYRNEIKAAQAWLGRYFLPDDKALQAVLATLKPMLSAPLNLNLPDLAESQSALRSLRHSKEKR